MSLVDDTLLKDREASQIIGVKTGTLANWRTQGRGPKFIKIGSLVFYRMSSLREYIAKNEINPETPIRPRKRA